MASRRRASAGLMAAAGFVLLMGCVAPTAESDRDDDRAAPPAAVTVPPAGTPTPAGPTPIGTPTPAGTPTPTAESPSAEATSACADPLGCYGEPRRVGQFDADAIPGASGLAASRRNPGVLYLLDDRPGTSEVWAVRVDGTPIGSIAVAGLDALDTESLAVGPCGGDESTACVYVGDIGDNLRARTNIAVHRFPEPDLSEGAPEAPVEAEVARWTYPAETHDAEALIVDDAGRAFIVTKARYDAERRETGDAHLYRAPAFADGVLEHLGVLPVPEPAAPAHSLFVGNVVTGGDYRDGKVLLRTYDQVLEYVAPESDADVATLASWPVRALPSPPELQSEAITWAPGGCGYYTAGEMVGDLWYVPCSP